MPIRITISRTRWTWSKAVLQAIASTMRRPVPNRDIAAQRNNAMKSLVAIVAVVGIFAVSTVTAQDRRRQQSSETALKPTHADVAYGSHERHKLDLYLAESPAPSPLVLFIHG